MPFIEPIDLPGNRIRCRSGYDGYEPKAILRGARALSENEERFVVVVATGYPGLLRDTYINKAMVALVHRAMNENDLHVVCEDIYSPGADMPEEKPGTLSQEEDYLLLSSRGTRVGSLRLWSYSWSSGGPFYGEFDLIMDMIIPKDVRVRLIGSLRVLAEGHSVTIEDNGCAAPRPTPLQRRTLFGRLLGCGRARRHAHPGQ